MAEQWWRTRRFEWIVLCLVLVAGGLAVLTVVTSDSGPGDRSAPRADPDVTSASHQEQTPEPEQGRVTGRVTGTDGRPLAGIEVVVRTSPFSPWSTGPGKPDLPPGPTWEGTTDDDGRYRVHAVAVGPHRVAFSGRGYATVYNGAALSVDDAADVKVEVDADTEVDAVLARAGRIRGRVTRTAGGPVGPDVQVEASLAGSAHGTVVSTDVTRSRGRYVLDGLPPGRYVVRVNHPRSGVVHHPAAIREKSATVLEVKEGKQLSDIDIDVPRPAVVTGRVLSQQGAPLSGVLVQVYEGIQDMGRYGQTAIGHEQVRTDRAGRYRFEKPTSTLTLWSGDAGGPRSCDPTTASVEGLPVEAGRTFVQDLRAPVPLSISGTVTDEDGKALTGIPVWVEGVENACHETVRTDASGRYSVSGLIPGKYHVQFADGADKPTGYFPKYHDGATDVEKSKPVVLRPGRSRTGLDVAVRKGGQIAGRVTLPRGVRLDSLSVVAVTGGEDGEDSFEQQAFVKKDGRFTVVGLRSGSYRLSFRPMFSLETSSTDEVPMHSYVRSGSSADPGADAEIIEVTQGKVTRGVEVRLDLGASISGTLVDENGEPRSDIEVVAHRRAPTEDGDPGWVRVGASRTDDRGRYDVRGLGAGTYRIGFAGSKYYPDVTDVDDARDLELDSGEAMTGIDAEVVFDWE